MLPDIQPWTSKVFQCDCSQRIQVTVKDPGIIFVRQWIDNVQRRVIPDYPKSKNSSEFSVEELNSLLKIYERAEEYEQCARIRDKINHLYVKKS